MRIMKPQRVLDADLLSTNVTETDYYEWDYSSSIITITIAAPAVVTIAALGFPTSKIVRGTPVVFSTTGALPTGITAGTTYYTGNVSGAKSSFNLYTDKNLTTIVNTSGSQSGAHTMNGRRYFDQVGRIVQLTNQSFTVDSNPALLSEGYGTWPFVAIRDPLIEPKMHLCDGIPVSMVSTGDLPGGITSGAIYYIRDYAVRPFGTSSDVAAVFRLSEKRGGPAIVAVGVSTGTVTLTAHIHSAYELLAIGTNTDFDESSPLYRASATSPDWAKVSPTNPWCMFDDTIGTQTKNANSISVSIQATDYADTVALFELDGASATITITSPTDGIVYDETHDLQDYDGLVDEWAYCFDPVEYLPELVLLDLPLYPDCTIGITITNTGDMASCGACLIGSAREIGGVQYGAQTGIQDYSVKQTDDFGNYSILERAFAKRAGLEVIVDNVYISKLQRVLSEYRAIPALYIGADDYSNTHIYGFYKDFSVLIAYPNQSICSIQLEGLT